MVLRPRIKLYVLFLSFPEFARQPIGGTDGSWASPASRARRTTLGWVQFLGRGGLLSGESAFLPLTGWVGRVPSFGDPVQSLWLLLGWLPFCVCWGWFFDIVNIDFCVAWLAQSRITSVCLSCCYGSVTKFFWFDILSHFICVSFLEDETS